MEKNKSYVKDSRPKVNIQTDNTKWKIVILENFRKKNIKFGVHTREKYQLQILIMD